MPNDFPYVVKDKAPMVYIAGPLGDGGAIRDPFQQLANARKAISEGNSMALVGIVPLIPHLHFMANILFPGQVVFEEWMRRDFEFIRRCDAVWILPGESLGTQMEIEFCSQNGIRMFDSQYPQSLKELMDYLKERGYKLLSR